MGVTQDFAEIFLDCVKKVIEVFGLVNKYAISGEMDFKTKKVF